MNRIPGEWRVERAEYDPRVDAEAIEMLIAALKAAEDRQNTANVIDASEVVLVIQLLLARMKARIEL